MDPTSRGYPAGELRVSDADRDAAVSELGEHFQAGRITVAELDERVGQAIRSQTGQDLAGIFRDLPAGPAGPAVQREPAARSGPGTGQLAGPARWRRAPALAGIAAVAGAVGVVAVIAIVASVQGNGRWAPWWLIPVAFFMIRRLAWGRRAGLRPGRGE